MCMRWIIVGNSPYKSFSSLYEFVEGDYFIGLDEGAFTILESGYTLNEAWGDFDREVQVEEVKEKAEQFHLFPKEKNETDLELVLQNLSPNQEILIYDITGGRLDHEVVNFLLLAKYKHLNIKIIDERNEVSYYAKCGEYAISQGEYQYVGLITFHHATITITKAKYLLLHAKITPLDTYTTSNQFEDGSFQFKLESGEILFIKSKA